MAADVEQYIDNKLWLTFWQSSFGKTPPDAQ